jgi:subtilisin family serine protease
MAITKVLISAPEDKERRAALRMTGRYLVTMQSDAHQDVAAKLSDAGFSVAHPMQPGARSARALPVGSYMMLPNVGIAVVDPSPEQRDTVHSLAARNDSIVSMEPERIVRAVSQENLSEYVRGWRDAVNALVGKLVEGSPSTPSPLPTALSAEPTVTWGLVATKVVNSRFSGANIKLAVLDTGFDLLHPDFIGRQVTTKNFVGDNKPFHDGVGHGTHCIGTAAGPLHAVTGPRYGIAYQSSIFAGRVLDDTGQGGDFNVLQGIDWAIEQHCDVVSLSLGAPWFPGDPPFSQAYETAARRALGAGCLLVVAAGNEAGDPRYVGAVGTPGNSPSVLTVAAVDSTFATAPFSDRVEQDAPGVKGPDLAGPGVAVYSSWPVADGQYNTISGTSMATPHIAGIAVLCAEANPSIRGQALKDLILSQCAALQGAVVRQGEIGHGLAQAPGTSGPSGMQATSRRRVRGSKALNAEA